eukprot:2763356-Pyramimonas_sp.AAC.2
MMHSMIYQQAGMSGLMAAAARQPATPFAYSPSEKMMIPAGKEKDTWAISFAKDLAAVRPASCLLALTSGALNALLLETLAPLHKRPVPVVGRGPEYQLKRFRKNCLSLGISRKRPSSLLTSAPLRLTVGKG